MKLYSKDVERQVAFENACDYLYYGYGRDKWKKNGHDMSLPEAVANKIWKAAFYLMAEDRIPKEYRDE